MQGLKKQLIKSFINIRVVSSKPGDIIIQSNALGKIQDQFKVYGSQIEKAAMILDGIEQVTPNYQNGTIEIIYDPNKLTPQKVVKWVHIIVDTFIDYWEVIQQNWENNMEYVEQTIARALEKRLREVR